MESLARTTPYTGKAQVVELIRFSGIPPRYPKFQYADQLFRGKVLYLYIEYRVVYL